MRVRSVESADILGPMSSELRAVARKRFDTKRVLVIGYGRFGRALSTLLREAGVEVRARDPNVAIPASLRENETGTEPGKRVVFLCVPVWSFEAVLSALRPGLTGEDTLVDVSSARSRTERAMRELLGSDVRWVGTHPLFGPSAIALGERPLRAIVCPNELHPEAVWEVCALYERIGCVVKLEEADEHDRRMAYSHALAFFVAKALMDVDAPTHDLFVPPSFRAFAKTVEAVRSDAGHLFLTIQNLNPHAAQAREDLLTHLARLHAELEAVQPTQMMDGSAGETLSISGLGEESPALRETRDLIDELDRELVRAIARRTQLAVRAGRIKREEGNEIRDRGREQEVLEERKQWAEHEGLAPGPVIETFATLMALARAAQGRDL